MDWICREYQSHYVGGQVHNITIITPLQITLTDINKTFQFTPQSWYIGEADELQ